MVARQHVPAKAGLGIVFDFNNGRSVHTALEPNVPVPASAVDGPETGLRAESEPANLSYQPELYQKLRSLWEQTSLLISASNPPTRENTPAKTRSEMELRTPNPPSEPARPSIVDAPIFKILYNNSANLTHFATTKRELPFQEIVHNKFFMRWVASKEGGLVPKYDEIRHGLNRLSRESSLRQNSPNLFLYFNNLLEVHEEYIQAGAQFLSYDLYMNMIDAYYGARGDVALLAKFPIKSQQAFESYIHAAAIATSDDAVAAREEIWEDNRLEWLRAETDLLRIKNDKELARRYDQLQKLMRIFNSRRTEIVGRQRGHRRMQALRRESRRKIIKELNNRNLRHQIGQAGLHPHTDEQIVALRTHVEAGNQTFIKAEEQLPFQMKGMKIEENGDSFAKLMPNDEQDANRLRLHGIT